MSGRGACPHLVEKFHYLLTAHVQKEEKYSPPAVNLFQISIPRFAVYFGKHTDNPSFQSPSVETDCEKSKKP